jgi:hypothetical protein
MSFYIRPDLAATCFVVAAYDAVDLINNFFKIDTDGGFELFAGGTTNGTDALRAGFDTPGTFVDGEDHLR